MSTECPMHEHPIECFSTDCAANGCAEQRAQVKAHAQANYEAVHAAVKRLPKLAQYDIETCYKQIQRLRKKYPAAFPLAVTLVTTGMVVETLAAREAAIKNAPKIITLQ